MFIPYVVIKMSENFNNLEEDITRKARVNFDCKCYKLIKPKPSLQDDSYHSETLANLLAYFRQTFSLMGMYFEVFRRSLENLRIHSSYWKFLTRI